MIELGVNRDRRDQVLRRVKPERFASPNQAADAVALQLDFLIPDLYFVFAAAFDGDFTIRQGGQRAAQLVRMQITHEHHLHGDRSVAANSEEALGHGGLARVFVFANRRGLVL